MNAVTTRETYRSFTLDTQFHYTELCNEELIMTTTGNGKNCGKATYIVLVNIYSLIYTI